MLPNGQGQAVPDVWAVDGGQCLVADARCLQVYVTKSPGSGGARRPGASSTRKKVRCKPTCSDWARTEGPWPPSARRWIPTPRWTSTCFATGANGPPPPGRARVPARGPGPHRRRPPARLADPELVVGRPALRRRRPGGHPGRVTKHTSLSWGGAPLLGYSSGWRSNPAWPAGPSLLVGPVARTRPDVGPACRWSSPALTLTLVSRSEWTCPATPIPSCPRQPVVAVRRRRLSRLPLPAECRRPAGGLPVVGPRGGMEPLGRGFRPGWCRLRHTGAGLRRPPPAHGTLLATLHGGVPAGWHTGRRDCPHRTQRPPLRQERPRGPVPGRSRRGSVHRRAPRGRRRRHRPALPVPYSRRHLRDRAPRAGMGRTGRRDPLGRRRQG